MRTGMRPIRQFVPGVAYHLIWRFVDRGWFFTSNEERAHYLRLLGRAISTSDWSCFSFALMDNHIHLGARAGHIALCDWTRRVNSPFAHWMNARYDRLGPLFAHRVADYAVMPAKVGSLIAYIHNNPVRAKVVGHARDSHWTSHRAYVGLEPAPAWLKIDAGIELGGVSRAEFDAYVEDTPGESGIVELDRIGRAIRRLGAVEVATPSATVIPLVARAFAHVRPDPRELVRLVADLGGVPLPLLCSQRRGVDVLVARRAAVHAGRAVGVSVTGLAAALGVSITAVSKIGRRALVDREAQLVRMVVRRLELSCAS
jgi:hypothetical protein